MSRRRQFLFACAALGASHYVHATLPRLLPPARRQGRVVIVGGGWGGLSAARYLRTEAPGLEVVLLERQSAFWSCPLSNKWLARLVETNLLRHDYAHAANAFGYTFIRTEVAAVDRDRRVVLTADGSLDYDWLVLAVGMRYEPSSWLGDDRRAIDHTLQHYPAGFAGESEFVALQRKLDGFAGGDLVMTIPPLPYRCPPAPYERAAMIAWLFKSRHIKGRLIVLDPNRIAPVFRRVYERLYPEQIDYRQDVQVKSVDPFGKTIATEFDAIRFDDAIICMPQQAGALIWQAGLIGRDGEGAPTGWADVDPFHLHARDDARVFVIGDALGPVSPLFGHYPKTGHLASSQGRIVAHEIATRAKGLVPAPLLPESSCYIMSDFDPMTMHRTEASYRVRGDGVIEQKLRQTSDPNPRGEDLAWARAKFAELLAVSPG